MPETQAQQWVGRIGKQFSDCNGTVSDTQKTQAPEDVLKYFVKVFRHKLKQSKELREQLKDATPTSAVQLFIYAPQAEVQYTQLVTKWKKVSKAFGG